MVLPYFRHMTENKLFESAGSATSRFYRPYSIFYILHFIKISSGISTTSNFIQHNKNRPIFKYHLGTQQIRSVSQILDKSRLFATKKAIGPTSHTDGGITYCLSCSIQKVSYFLIRTYGLADFGTTHAHILCIPV